MHRESIFSEVAEKAKPEPEMISKGRNWGIPPEECDSKLIHHQEASARPVNWSAQQPRLLYGQFRSRRAKDNGVIRTCCNDGYHGC